MNSIEQRAERLRRRLARELEHAGHLSSPEWRAAIEAVPRHEFIREFFARIDPPDGSPTVWDPIDEHRSGVEKWLDMTYVDESHVTQLDENTTPAEVNGAIANANPTSSSTMPNLVIRMWEDLDVHDRDRVLEIGTGTGYSTALGCHRLGDDHITSIEIDPAVAARAKAALTRAGYRPHLVVGDGLGGVPEHAPYDRIIATCAVRRIPAAWVAQSRPGTVILVTLSGWLGASELARLTVTRPGVAEGRFLTGGVSFMPARAHAPEPVMIPKLDEDVIGMRAAVFGPEILTDPGPARMVAQLVAPQAQYLPWVAGDTDATRLLVASDGCYAAFDQTSSGWRVRQGGQRAVWDSIEQAVTTWHSLGRPPLDTFRITVGPQRQTVRIGNSITWDLPS
jgi:methyltransferase of ATP-grasp peptide maturase system